MKPLFENEKWKPPEPDLVLWGFRRFFYHAVLATVTPSLPLVKPVQSWWISWEQHCVRLPKAKGITFLNWCLKISQNPIAHGILSISIGEILLYVCLVVTGTCFIFPYIGNHNPNRGVGIPPTRYPMKMEHLGVHPHSSDMPSFLCWSSQWHQSIFFAQRMWSSKLCPKFWFIKHDI